MTGDGGGPPESALRERASDEELLTEALNEVIAASEGEGALELLDEAVSLGRDARAGDAAAADRLEELVAGLDLERAEVLVRSLTRRFQLVNIAEDNERIQRLRAREAREAPAPRRGSMRHAIAEHATRGTTADELRELLAGAELRLVMTAHPTEARRRTTINKLARLFGVLRERETAGGPDDRGPEADSARRRLLGTVQELWGSDELRATSLGVLDEVRGGLDPLRRDARRHRAARLPRPRARARRALPGRALRRAAAAELRLLDRRRPRRQSARHAGCDRRGARADARAVPALRRGTGRAARGAVVAVRARRRCGGGAGSDPRGGGAAVPRARGAARRAQPRGALPPRDGARARARAGDAPRRGRRLRRAGRAARRPAPRRALAARGRRGVHRCGRPARRDPPGRGVRLPLRAAGHPRARACAPPLAGRDIRRPGHL